QRSADCRRIEQITDSRANTIVFNYADVQVFGSTLKQLTSVDYPDGTTKEYSYETVLDTQVDPDSGDVTNHFHCNIKKITDKNGKSHTFHYALDRSKSYYVSSGGRSEFAVNINYLPQSVEDDLNLQLAQINDQAPPGTAEYKLMYGQPRQVVRVDLPDSIGYSQFAKTAGTQTTYGPNFSAASGTTVTDALGNVTAYTFSNIDGEVVDVDDTGDSVSTEWMIYYTQMQVHHGALEGQSGHLGKETFNFDLASGLSLSSMTDFSGNTTTWLFEDDIVDGRKLPQLENAAAFMSKWADPTKKTDALGREETYQYGNFRIMSEVNDVHGTVTVTQVDAKGRRDSMTVTDASGTKLSEEDYTYADQDADPTNDAFPAFMVEKRVVAYQNLSGEAWEQDLVTKYVPDNRGRLWKEIVDPGGLDLTTEFAYDLNNNRISIKDPRGNETLYAYDELNRLVQVTNPIAGTSSGVDAATYVRKLYDARGNLVCEVNEENQYTLHFYDALSRRVKTVRDMDGLGLPTLPLLTEPQILELDEATHITAADIVTQMSYNAVNSVDTATDPRGTVTKNFYDELQRLRHTYTHFEAGDANADGTENGTAVAGSSEKTHTEFIYDIANNTGASGFSSGGFKPTQVIRHDAVRGADGTSGLWTLTTHASYDDVYRPVQTRVEYAPGSFNQTDTAYGAITTGKEALVTTVTDALSRDTVTHKDGLKRTTKVVFADLTEVETRYSSTGLAYESEDELDRITNTEFDLAGRAVLVKAPAVYNALSGSYERPETETIYDDASNVFQTINPLDEVWEFEYDARNRRVKETQPAVAYVDESGNWQTTAVSPEIETAFDGMGNVISVTDARDFVTTTFYDRANRATHVFTPSVDYWNGSATQNAHLVTRTIYDDNSNPLEIWQGHSATVDPAAVVIDRLKVSNTYDKLNRLATTAQDVDGDSDTTNLIAAVIGATDITVTNEHDDAGNRVAVEDGEAQRTEFYFDGLERNTAVHYGVTTDFSSTAWVDGKRMVFDALRQTHRLMGTTPGNDALSGFTADADSHVTAYGYDSRDRLTSVDYEDDATIDRQYTLDAVGNILAVDEIDGSTIGTETIADVAYVWDALNRQRAEYSAGDWHVYEYDLAGNRIDTHYSVTDAALTDPQDQADGTPIVETALIRGASVVAGRSLNSDYDALNRLETVTEGTRVSGYRYDLAGNIREKSQPNGDIIKRTFDALGRKAVITGPGTSGSELYVYTHTFDLFGNLVRIVETYPAGQLTPRTVTNTNDGADRLKVEAVTGTNAATTTYAYDRANNRTLRTFDDGTPETWRYAMVSGLNRLDYAWIDSNGDETWATGEARRDYTYNNLGVMSAITGSEGDTTDQDFEYDYENRLLDVADSTASKDYTYAYDYRTRRSLRDESSAGGVSTEVSFSGGTSAREYDGGSSTPTVEYVRGSDYGGGIGGILYTLRSGTPSFKHYNSRGDVVAATDGTGSLTYQAAYEAFARHGDTPSSEEWGSTADRQQGNTKDEDGWGALNEGFRYRLLDEGVFMQPDQLGYADGVNHYVYVKQNPLTYYDPLGLYSWKEYKRDFAQGWQSITDFASPAVETGGAVLNLANDYTGALMNSLSGGLVFDDHAARFEQSAKDIATGTLKQLSQLSTDAQGALDGLGQGDLSGLGTMVNNFIGHEESDSGERTAGKMLLAGLPWLKFLDDVPTGPQFRGTDKPWTEGATPNSTYFHLDKNGKLKQTALYDENGNVIGHVDYKNHGTDAPSGHGHYFPEAGNPASGHGKGKPHIPREDLPENWVEVPSDLETTIPVGE
ncbi:MAG: RHS repeat-associated core domain-containing protein, partial [Opitutales bacterium]